jgi:hypothetical protein
VKIIAGYITTSTGGSEDPRSPRDALTVGGAEPRSVNFSAWTAIWQAVGNLQSEAENPAHRPIGMLTLRGDADAVTVRLHHHLYTETVTTFGQNRRFPIVLPLAPAPIAHGPSPSSELGQDAAVQGTIEVITDPPIGKGPRQPDLAIQLLRAWRDADQEEQRNTLALLSRTTDEDRLSNRRRF